MKIKSDRYIRLWFWLVIMMSVISLLAQDVTVKIEHLPYEEGIPHNLVYAILQDSTGFMWFGTMYGLVKYDGNRYYEFRHDPEDPFSLSFNSVISIYEDSRSRLWVGTLSGGLNCYDRDTNRFIRYMHDPRDSTSIADNTVWAIAEDQQGNLWFGTQNGLSCLPDDSTGFHAYYHDPENISSLAGNFIRSLCVDHQDRLWVGVFGSGVHYFDRAGDNFIRLDGENKNVVAIYEDRFHSLWAGNWGNGLDKIIITHPDSINRDTVHLLSFHQDSGNPNSLNSNYIWSLGEDHLNNLWIGTDQGLNRFNRVSGRYSHFRHDPSAPNSLSSNNVASIYEDRSGVLWIGTFRGGIDRLIPGKIKFQHYRHQTNNSQSLSNNDVSSIHEDSRGRLWVGTLGGGLNRFDRKNKIFKRIEAEVQSSRLSSLFINALASDSTGNLWIGTYNGLNRMDVSGNISTFYYDSTDTSSLSGDHVTTLLVDQQQTLWIGTMQNGINRFRTRSGKFEHIRHEAEDSLSLSHDYILSLYEDSRGGVWIGTFDGLDRFEGRDDSTRRYRFKHFKHETGQNGTISDNHIYSLAEDQQENLWIGTSRGLNLFNRISETFRPYYEKNGLPNSVICGIIADNKGNLWISTNKGLCKFKPETGEFRNYDALDGLQSNVFNPTVYTRCRDGALLFGGINGLNMFYPAEVKDNTNIPPIVITGFKKYDDYVNLKRDQEVQLDYSDRFFTIEFAALDYTIPEKNRYEYRLEGFDPDWINGGTGNTASYTNIEPGDYIFRVRGSNNDGRWNVSGSSLSIHISPPFWRTAWFRALVILLFITALYMFVYQVRRIEKRKADINRKISELKLQALRSRLNPHFIFNTINSIQYFLTTHDERAALNYLSKFSKLMRKILDSSDKTHILLEEELESLQLFLQLEHLRFEQKFEYSIDVDQDINLSSVKVPTMLIQPYVENAVKHGIQEQMDGKSRIRIALHMVKESIICTIEDNGVGIRRALALKAGRPGEHRSSGLKITEERLELINPGKNRAPRVRIFDLADLDEDSRGTRVEIHIPVVEA